ncbi:MAG: DNA-protecting protein DprA [Ignavibacterium sp.]|nr:DNA-protecting protein DprA [Ignavibacterium sp.]MDW8374931.1 DNA-processing protein DprA [Ignavibacteriales bacterium]
MIKDAAYWISFAHTKQIRTAKLNEILKKIYYDEKISISDFFNLEENYWRTTFRLNDEEIQSLIESKSELTNNSFLAEDLFNQGFNMIPIISEDYPERLKSNLSLKDKLSCPPLLYIKGDKQIFTEKAIAIVGSREASAKALEFTDNIARIATKEFKVIVSGFAKGVDKQALESALKYTGRSIIVLPQGITTFSSGFKKYYKQIVDGDVLVLSTFHPKAPWSVELAMARNPIIYALADEIYIAETSEKGGTWAGAIDGLRRKRIIYVRKPETDESNANNLLIEKGAIPVNIEGELLSSNITPKYNFNSIPKQEMLVRENPNNLEQKIYSILNGNLVSASEIIKKINSDWSVHKMTNYLKTLEFVEIRKKDKLYFTVKNSIKEDTLFDMT